MLLVFFVSLILCVANAQLNEPIGYIRTGRTWTQTVGSPQDFYATLNDQSYKTWVYQINNITGGIVINGTRYFIQDINYNDGADCYVMQLIYEHMILVDKVQFLFAPVQPNCAILALIAENYSIPYLNGADYTLPLLMQTPGSGYDNLSWVYNTQENLALYGESCVKAVTTVGNIQAPASVASDTLVAIDPRVKTFVAAYNVEIPYLVQQVRAALLANNATELYPLQTWDLAQILANGCEYLGPTIDQWQKLKPDLIVATSGASNASIFVNCLHERLYQPPVLWPIPPIEDPAFPQWHQAGSISEVGWLPTADFPDPVFGSLSELQSLYSRLWNGSVFSSYQITIIATAIILTQSIIQSQSLDSYVIREHIRSFNATTAYGPTSFQLAGGANYIDRLVICQQILLDDPVPDANTPSNAVAVYPPSWPGAIKADYPYPFVFPQYWKDELSHSKYTQQDYVLIGIFSSLGLLLLLALGAFLIYKWKYYTVMIPKGEMRGGGGGGGGGWN